MLHIDADETCGHHSWQNDAFDRQTDRSGRAISEPGFVTSALRVHKARREALAAKRKKWDDNRLVFVTRSGKLSFPRNVVRSFKDQLEDVVLSAIRY